MRSLIAAFLLFLAAQAPALTNADIVRMIAAKLGDGVIVTAIQDAARTNFDVSVDGLIALKQAGASDTVIHAMQRAAAAPPRVPPTPPAPAAVPPVPAAPAVSPTPAAPAPVRGVSLAEPQEPFVYYRVNPSTGQLMRLEEAETKVPSFSAYLTVSIKGVASPITFPHDEPHVFVVTRFLTQQGLADQQKRGLFGGVVESLAIEKDRRYATKVYVPIDVELYGEQKITYDEKKRPVTRQNYKITPRAPLRPGQYAITPSGMWQEHVVPPTVAAFGIVAK
jgi:hypothetical protein